MTTLPKGYSRISYASEPDISSGADADDIIVVYKGTKGVIPLAHHADMSKINIGGHTTKKLPAEMWDAYMDYADAGLGGSKPEPSSLRALSSGSDQLFSSPYYGESSIQKAVGLLLGETYRPRKRPKKTRRDKQYPDTLEGAFAYLKDDAPPSITGYLEGATGFPDPGVQGVWAVDLPDEDETRVLVYLAGYEGPMGDIRMTNDFELEQ